MLDLGHPAIGGKTALFVGDYYVFLNNRFGAAYDSNGRVRRATIEYKKREGKRSLELLTQPSGPNPPLLLHVDTSLPTGIKPLEQFWSGVDTDESIIASSGKEILVSFQADQSWADVFYGDGSVKRVVRMGAQLVVQKLSLEEQAERRIEQALWNIQEAKNEQEDDRRIRHQDLALHQLIAVLAIGGGRSQTIFTQVFDLLKDMASGGNMRPNVLSHTMDVLKRRFPDSVMEFETASLPSKFAGAPMKFGTSQAPSDHRNIPSDRKRKLAERRTRDQIARAAARGTSEDKCIKNTKNSGAKNQNSGGKKK